MKKFFKVLIIIILILVVLLIINLIRNYTILKDIYIASNELINNHSNYYLKLQLEPIENSKELASTSEYYYKDGIILKKTIFNNEESIQWYDSNTGEFINSDTTDKDTKEKPDYLLNCYELVTCPSKDNLKDIFFDYFFKPITSEEDCYKIKIDNNKYVLFNKDTKLVEKVVFNNQSKEIYTFTQNIVTNEDVLKENVERKKRLGTRTS